MTQVIVYGIKNCDTMKKTFAWLEENAVSYQFHDYKKSGVDADLLRAAIKNFGWEHVLNRKGTTWRNLSEAMRETMNDQKAVDAALANPSLIRRPLIVVKGKMHWGFDPAAYAKLFR